MKRPLSIIIVAVLMLLSAGIGAYTATKLSAASDNSLCDPLLLTKSGVNDTGMAKDER